MQNVLSIGFGFVHQNFTQCTFQVDGYLRVVYNLGQQDIVIQDSSVRVNDGKYHVVRFVRTGVNSTLQVDDNQVTF